MSVYKYIYTHIYTQNHAYKYLNIHLYQLMCWIYFLWYFFLFSFHKFFINIWQILAECYIKIHCHVFLSTSHQVQWNTHQSYNGLVWLHQLHPPTKMSHPLPKSQILIPYMVKYERKLNLNKNPWKCLQSMSLRKRRN